MDNHNFIKHGIETIKLEADALSSLSNRIDGDFEMACRLMLDCPGRVVVSGMGKSGLIGRKIAATLASTGTPAFFVHPAEASHGDLGMIQSQDIVLAISNSGNTEEVTTLLPLIKRMGSPLIALTGNPNSALAKQADVNLDISVDKEAGSLALAPTTSTTVTLALGDALAIALLEARDFTADDFALAHPGGSLGRRLILTVADLMHTGDNVPIVLAGTPLADTLLEMTQKKLGMTTIVDSQGALIGIYTDGDVRRTLQKGIDIKNTSVEAVMTAECKTCTADILAAEALRVMEDSKINGLIVIDQNSKPIGALNMQDLLRAGVL